MHIVTVKLQNKIEKTYFDIDNVTLSNFERQLDVSKFAKLTVHGKTVLFNTALIESVEILTGDSDSYQISN